ncbi:MAG TPA: hypothetical protein VN429_07580 [Methanospirillum sp.]|nr:hypothetical protein [Methanospirillum sp.]
MSAVLYQGYSGRHLCADHLCADIVSRAKRVIRQNHWLIRGDRIGFFEGMRGSEPLFVFLENLLDNRSDVGLIRLNLPDFDTLKEPVSLQALSEIAVKAGVTRIALSDTAEDVAVRTLEALFSDNVDPLLNGHHSGLSIPVMLPFREIPDKELQLFADHYGVSAQGLGYQEHHRNSLEKPLLKLLGEFTASHPSAPHALRHYHDNLLLLSRED